ncbi:MAG: class I SAM-dependent methyltransferase [Bacteroidales bacterium]|nr:MAG: class I SAM-dependent methyltransferase [Bacteroidales bacterium]
MSVKKIMLGIDRETIPDIGFYLMSLFFKVYYFLNPQDKYINSFGIKPGDVVIDYGCGPGDYIKLVSAAAGPRGRVYAVDIHKLAIKSVKKLIKKKNLHNVTPVLADGYSCGIKDNTADLIYALDMFHMIEDTNSFLNELNRLLKKDGILILEDGHQERESSREKIKKSGKWEITGEAKRHIRCKPLK